MASRREAVGLSIDGLDIKMAHLSLQRGKIILRALSSDTLVERLEAKKAPEGEEEEGRAPEEEDVFGLEEAEAAGEAAADEEPEEEQSNASVVLSLLSKVEARQYQLGVNLPEAKIDYYPFDEAPSAKGKKLKKAIRDRIQADREQQLEEIALERIQSFSGDQESLIGVVHDGQIAALSALENLRTYARGMRIDLIDTNETALADLVKTNYELGEDEVTAIVYIGKEFSRVVFARGEQWIGFCPLVNEGAESPQVCNTLLARVLYEQDVSGVPDINRFILAGESVRADAKSFFANEFPNAEVEYLTPRFIDVSGVELPEGEDLSFYAIPMAIAYKMLDYKNPKLYPLNFLPARIRERQNVYKIGWHGMLVMLLVGLCAYHFTFQWGKRRQEIYQRDANIRKLSAQIEARQDTLALIDSLSARIAFFEGETALTDSLTRGLVRWSPYLEKLARSTRKVGRLWFTEFNTGANDIALEGSSLSVAPLPRISYQLESSTVKGYFRKEIRGRNVFAYSMAWKLLEPNTEVGR